MEDRFKKIKYYRKGEVEKYLFSIFNELNKVELNNGTIYTKNDEFVILGCDGKKLFLSSKYIWIYVSSTFKISNIKIITVVKEAIDLFFPEYSHLEIDYSNEIGGKYHFINCNKLNQLFFKKELFHRMKIYYVFEDVIYMYYRRISFKKGDYIYYNGCNLYKIDLDKKKNTLVMNYFNGDIKNDKIHKLNLNDEHDMWLFKKIKPHLLINSEHSNYYFQ